MHDARRVRLVERARDLAEVGDGSLRSEWPLGLQDPAEVLAVEQLHHQEGHARAVVDTGVEDVDDVLAFDVGGDACLELEALPEVAVGEQLGEHDLQRATALGFGVHDFEHGAHPARRDAPHDAVAPREERRLRKVELTQHAYILPDRKLGGSRAGGTACQTARTLIQFDAMQCRPLGLGLCASLAGLLFATNAAAEDTATAGALFEKGVADMEAKHYASACPAIEESQRIDPRPGTLFTLAECLAQWGKIASAVARYQEYVDLVPLLAPQQQARHRDRLASSRAQLDKLKPTVPTLTLVLPPNAPAGTTVVRNGETLGSAALGLPLPVDPGRYEIVTRAPGVADRQTSVTLELGDAKRLELEMGTALAPPSAQPEGSPPAVAASAAGDTKQPAEPPPAPSNGSGRRTAAYVAGGIGIAGIVAGSITGILVLGKKQTVDENCPNHECNDPGYSAVTSAQSLGLVSTIGFGVGIAGLATGAVLLLTGSEPSPSARTWQPVLTAGAGTYGGGFFRRW